MKYKLINTQTQEEHICDKVTIDGFDYYRSKFIDKINSYINEEGKPVVKYVKDLGEDLIWESIDGKSSACDSKLHFNSVIATTNPNINIPKVVDETLDYKFDREFFNPLIAPIVDEIRQKDYSLFLSIGGKLYDILFENYKSQETHPNSDEDMIEFNEWLEDNMQQREYYPMSSMNYKELLQLWKDQKPKKVYYES